MKVKGMRNLSTLHRNDRSVPRNRTAGLAELTYLEQERSRLERKLQFLTEQQAKTAQLLAQVQQRTSLVQGVLYQDGAEPSPVASRPRPRPSAASPARKEISLEY
jgi:hypothetical protein